MIKRILVGIGGTPYTPVAIRRSVELARLHGAELTATTVFDVREMAHVGAAAMGVSSATQELRDYRLKVGRKKIEQSLADFESACTAAAVSHTVCHETDDPFTLMASLSRYHDLMVFGLRKIFDVGFGLDPPDVLARLVEQGVRPILAVPDQFRPIHRVLMAYSGSAESAKTIKRFVQMQLWPDLTCQLVTCSNSAEEAKRRLTDMSAYCRAHGVEVETLHLPGSPRQRILAHAEHWNADLIVLGKSARSYFMRKIFGETALHVIEHSDRTLFLAY
ncbi:MAG TPA: universal stress protein [Thermoguttaceae bacterium]|nr:universal stress protein [Thermoguttaceae bacterium]